MKNNERKTEREKASQSQIAGYTPEADAINTAQEVLHWNPKDATPSFTNEEVLRHSSLIQNRQYNQIGCNKIIIKRRGLVAIISGHRSLKHLVSEAKKQLGYHEKLHIDVKKMAIVISDGIPQLAQMDEGLYAKSAV